MIKREKNKILALVIVAFVLFIPVLVGIYIFFGLFVFNFEGMGYELYGEVHSLAKEIKQYKQENGVYPDRILDIRSSNKLCVWRGVRFCRRVHYKASDDKQDFRMAIKSFTWPILYYNPEMSMTTEEARSLSEGEKKEITDKYGMICFFCEAFPQGKKYLRGEESQTPVYREDPKIFEHHELWPEL